MDKFGYILVRPGDSREDVEEDINRMQDLGCGTILKEEDSAKAGQAWERLLARLEKGDEVVVPRLSDVLGGSRQLAFFIEFIQKKEVRLVAFRDKIDTADELFPEAKTMDILRALSAIPKKARRKPQRRLSLKALKPGMTEKSVAKDERDKLMVNMYNQGFSIEEIHRASGMRSRSSVFRLLTANGVTLNRASSRSKSSASKRKSAQAEPEGQEMTEAGSKIVLPEP